MENYLAISIGMSYSEVCAILGGPGEEASRNEIAGYTTVAYVWKKWTGANMNAIFQNGKLMSKSQAGLN